MKTLQKQLPPPHLAVPSLGHCQRSPRLSSSVFQAIGAALLALIVAAGLLCFAYGIPLLFSALSVTVSQPQSNDLPVGCRLPKREGDRLLISAERTDGKIALRCQASNSPRWMKGLTK